MEVAKVTSKGQITIPISIRRKLDINEGDKVLFIYKTDGVMMVNPNTFQGVDAAEAAESEAVAVEAPVKAKKANKAPPAVTKEPVAAIEPATEDPVEEAVVEENIPKEASKKSVPPPVDEPEPPDKQVAGLNLSSLLDDIRSIGSNI